MAPFHDIHGARQSSAVTRAHFFLDHDGAEDAYTVVNVGSVVRPNHATSTFPRYPKEAVSIILSGNVPPEILWLYRRSVVFRL
jgi:hypothetical protein